MYRYTTPTHVFTLPFTTSNISELILTYSQGRVKVNKRETDCTLSGSTVTVSLTQQETKLFSSDSKVEVQMRVKTTANKVIASNIILIDMNDVLNEEVM